MRFLVLFALVLGACTSAVMVESTTSIPTTTTSTQPAPATSTTTTTTTTTTLPSTRSLFADEPIGLVTPTGVNVAVLDHNGRAFIVRTPCGNIAEVSHGEQLSDVSVVIDPGHGGPIDTGTVGANGLVERDLNLQVARVTETELLSRGISVVLTRTADYPTPLGVRTRFADHLGADLMVSIHHNAPKPGPSSLPGTEVFIQSDSDDSRRLGQLVWEHVREGLSVFDGVAWSAASDVGVLRVLNTRGLDAYGMIRGPETVSVLAELAYLNNPAEARLMATPEYVEVAGALVADAIEAYITTDDRGSGYVASPRVFNPNPGVGASVCIEPELQ